MKIYHSSKISKEQHRKLLQFIDFKQENVDELSFECERITSSDNILNITYAYRIEKYLDMDDLLKIVNDTLTISKQNKIIKISNLNVQIHVRLRTK